VERHLSPLGTLVSDVSDISDVSNVSNVSVLKNLPVKDLVGELVKPLADM
jgi:hypothetical protein